MRLYRALLRLLPLQLRKSVHFLGLREFPPGRFQGLLFCAQVGRLLLLQSLNSGLCRLAVDRLDRHTLGADHRDSRRRGVLLGAQHRGGQKEDGAQANRSNFHERLP